MGKTDTVELGLLVHKSNTDTPWVLDSLCIFILL